MGCPARSVDAGRHFVPEGLTPVTDCWAELAGRKPVNKMTVSAARRPMVRQVQAKTLMVGLIRRRQPQETAPPKTKNAARGALPQCKTGRFQVQFRSSCNALNQREL